MKTNSNKAFLSSLYRWPSLLLLFYLMAVSHSPGPINPIVVSLCHALLGVKFIYVLLLVANYVGVLVIKREIESPFSKQTLSTESRDNWLFWVLPYQTNNSIKCTIVLTIVSTIILSYKGEPAIGLINALLTGLLIILSLSLITLTKNLVIRSRSNV